MKIAGKNLICVVAMMLVCALLLPLSACSEAGKQPADPDAALPEIIIGCDEYEPYVCFDDNGGFTGLDVTLATEAFRRMGYRVKFVRITWSEKDLLLEKGEVDCLWGCFSMNGREDRYRWAGPYLNSRQVVAVPAGSGIRTLADLADKQIAVQTTSKPDELFSAGGNGRIPEIGKLYCFTSIDNVFAALRKGYVDAIAGHEAAIRTRLAEQQIDEGYIVLDESLLDVQLGVAFSRNSDGTMAAELTRTLAGMVQDGFTEKVLGAYGFDIEKALTGVVGYDSEQ